MRFILLIFSLHVCDSGLMLCNVGNSESDLSHHKIDWCSYLFFCRMVIAGLVVCHVRCLVAYAILLIPLYFAGWLLQGWLSATCKIPTVTSLSFHRCRIFAERLCRLWVSHRLDHHHDYITCITSMSCQRSWTSAIPNSMRPAEHDLYDGEHHRIIIMMIISNWDAELEIAAAGRAAAELGFLGVGWECNRLKHGKRRLHFSQWFVWFAESKFNSSDWSVRMKIRNYSVKNAPALQ